MLKQVLVIFLITILLIFSACTGSPSSEQFSAYTGTPSSEQPPVATPMEIIEIYNDPYVPFYTADLADVVEVSDIIIVGRVEETLPAELIGSGDSKYVQTPANIMVLQSLKGKYEAGETLKIYQSGGVAGGVDFRPTSLNFHKEGETYLFFIINEGDVLYSEHADDNKTLDGYFFDGKSTDKVISIINDCIKNGKIKIETHQIKSFSFSIDRSDGSLIYYVDKADLEAQITLNGVDLSTEKWDAERWSSFVSDLEKCGVLSWEKHFSGTIGRFWNLAIEIDIGYLQYGTDVYPDGWDAFISIIDDYFGGIE